MINEKYYHTTIVVDRIKSLEDEIAYYKTKMSATPMGLVEMSKIVEEIDNLEGLLSQNYMMIFSFCHPDQVH